jgi:RHS repeat-associated protein
LIELNLSVIEQVSAGTSATATTFTYDGLDRVVTRKQGTAAVTTFRYAGLEADAASDGSGQYWARTPGGTAFAMNVGTATAVGAAAATYSVGQNRHGDLTHLFTTAGAYTLSRTYNPFGGVINTASVTGTAASVVPRFGYQGDYTDPTTGDVNMGARWYRPGAANFLSRDSYAGTLNTPVSLNRYTYANNSPLNFWDPTGREAEVTDTTVNGCTTRRWKSGTSMTWCGEGEVLVAGSGTQRILDGEGVGEGGVGGDELGVDFYEDVVPVFGKKSDDVKKKADKWAGSNVGRKLVVKHAALINQLSKDHKITTDVIAKILMEENNFGEKMDFLSRNAEILDPRGDNRRGIANHHNHDLVNAIQNLGKAFVKGVLGEDMYSCDSGPFEGFDECKRKTDESWDNPKHRPGIAVIQNTQNNERLSIKVLVLALASVRFQLVQYEGGGVLTFDEALIYSRKVGDDAAVDLYAGDIKAYSVWLESNDRDDFRIRKDLKRPSWLDRYDKYGKRNPAGILRSLDVDKVDR